MPMLIALALAAVTPAQSADIRCVAQLAIVAGEQKQGTGWTDYPKVGAEGPDYAAIVGEDVMNTTGKTREEVRDMILGEVSSVDSAVQKRDKSVRAEIDRCAAAMHARVRAQPGAIDE